MRLERTIPPTNQQTSRLTRLKGLLIEELDATLAPPTQEPPRDKELRLKLKILELLNELTEKGVTLTQSEVLSLKAQGTSVTIFGIDANELTPMVVKILSKLEGDALK